MCNSLSWRSPFRRSATLAVVVLVASCAALAGGCSTSVAERTVAPAAAQAGQQPTPASNILVSGRAITPAGTASGPVGGMPQNIIVSPDGKYAVTTSSSLDELLCVLRIGDGAIVSSVSYATMGPNVSANNGLFYGLVFDPVVNPNNTYTLYAAQGPCSQIAVLELAADGTLTQKSTIFCSQFNVPPPVIKPATGYAPAGLALDAQGYLYFSNYIPTDFVSPYAGASTLCIYNTRTQAYVGTYTFPGTTPCFPLAVSVKSDGSTAYVTSQRDNCVYVLNTSDKANPTLTATLVASHPDALLLNKAETLLYIANALSDSISVVDTRNNTILSTALLRPANVQNLPGVTPTGLALSPDEKTLYATLGDFNAVATIDAGPMQLSGYIPVGWYPTAVVVSPDSKCLLVTNGWGTSAMNPNPQFNYLNPSFLGFSSNGGPPSWNASPAPGYVLNSILGNVSKIDLSQALPALAQSTVQVVHNAQNTPAMGSAAASALAGLGVKSGKIQHVIYVIRENRSYDEVFGDLPQGNGAPSLAIFGSQVTPNAHALAQRFILLDNFYNNAPVSGEGWVWCTQSLANAFVVRNIPYIYRLAPATYNLNYSFEGQVANYITGGFPALDPDGKRLSSLSPNGLPAIKNVTEAPGGYIWDAVKAAGLSYRNYGFYYSNGVSNPPADPSNPSAANWSIPDNYPNATNLQPPGHDLAGVSDYDYRKFDFNYSDSDAWVKHGLPGPALKSYGKHNMPSRFSEWNCEFQQMLEQEPSGSKVPHFMTVRFMRDHTMGTNPGFESPVSMIADNDYAVGQLVEAVSKSPIWMSTAIFVIEDDAQFGPDHVDAHRSPCLVISPWIRQGTVDSHFYDTNSVLKSMELLLGLHPMSQYDASINPILGGWDVAPKNQAPYQALLPALSVISQVNPKLSSLGAKDPRRHLAVLSAQMNFRVADAAPSQLLNEIVWKSVKGPNSKMPAPRLSKLTVFNKKNPPRDDDD